MKSIQKNLFVALTATLILLPGLSSADRLLKGKGGTQVCLGASGGKLAIRNPNSKKMIVTKITMYNGDGDTVVDWTAGKSMPDGMPGNGVIPPRGTISTSLNTSVAADANPKALAVGNLTTHVKWKTTGPKVKLAQPMTTMRFTYFGDNTATRTGVSYVGCYNL